MSISDPITKPMMAPVKLLKKKNPIAAPINLNKTYTFKNEAANIVFWAILYLDEIAKFYINPAKEYMYGNSLIKNRHNGTEVPYSIKISKYP